MPLGALSGVGGDKDVLARYLHVLGTAACRPLGQGLWEVRTKLRDRGVRVMFFFESDLMILTHGFVKKERQTPPRDMRLARDRKRQWEGISNVPQQ